MRMYAITATVTHHTAEGESTSQVPTFYLHPNVQGILTEEHAHKVALGILSSGVPDGPATVSIHATAVAVHV